MGETKSFKKQDTSRRTQSLILIHTGAEVLPLLLPNFFIDDLDDMAVVPFMGCFSRVRPSPLLSVKSGTSRGMQSSVPCAFLSDHFPDFLARKARARTGEASSKVGLVLADVAGVDLNEAWLVKRQEANTPMTTIMATRLTKRLNMVSSKQTRRYRYPKRSLLVCCRLGSTQKL